VDGRRRHSGKLRGPVVHKTAPHTGQTDANLPGEKIDEIKTAKKIEKRLDKKPGLSDSKSVMIIQDVKQFDTLNV
jgi:hypothetical protein